MSEKKWDRRNETERLSLVKSLKFSKITEYRNSTSISREDVLSLLLVILTGGSSLALPHHPVSVQKYEINSQAV